jgi:tRNA-modifying protein YgfZ
MDWENDPAPGVLDAFFEGRPLSESRQIVVVEGSDAAAFLQGQCSQDIEGLEPGERAWSLLLEPDGKLGFLLWVLRRGPERFALVPARGAADEVVARLARFRLRVKVDLATVAMAWTVTWGEEGTGRSIQWDLSEEASDGVAFDLDTLAAWIGHLLPDDGKKGMVPNELGPWLEATVSFTKGCYTGQELVARIDARGAAPVSQLVWFRGARETPAGIELREGADVAGVVLRSAWNAERSIVHGVARIKRGWLPAIGSSRVVDGVELLG